jgi:rare lipoprotein A
VIRAAILGLVPALLLAGCMPHRSNLAPSAAVFTIGQPYQAGGEWLYPHDFNSYHATGLATVYQAAPDTTADHERYDPDALAAASPVLQLPAVVTVTNLVNGYSTEVRVNDRGPAIPGRVLEVTPRVARLLNFPVGGVVEVAVTMDQAATASLDGALGDGPKMTAAPIAGITAQPLGTPGGAAPAIVEKLGPTRQAGMDANPDVQLSGRVTVAAPAPGPLYVQIPGFGREYDAYRMKARLYGMPSQITPEFGGDRTLYAVQAGPYHSVAAADAALHRILSLGIPDPEIIVR